MTRRGALAVRGLGVLTLLLALAGCGSGAGAPTPPPASSGIDLRTLEGPTCPVEVQGQPPCEKAFSAVVQVLDAHGKLVTTVQTGVGGTARVPLPAGTYTLQAQRGRSAFPRAPGPTTATVAAHAFTTVKLIYDTGIR